MLVPALPESHYHYQYQHVHHDDHDNDDDDDTDYIIMIIIFIAKGQIYSEYDSIASNLAQVRLKCQHHSIRRFLLILSKCLAQHR